MTASGRFRGFSLLPGCGGAAAPAVVTAAAGFGDPACRLPGRGVPERAAETEPVRPDAG